MNDIAIRVEKLSKKYTIGLAQHRHDTLRDALVDTARSLTSRDRQRRKDETTLWALKDVSFEVRQGEVVGIIGRNGAGKSTLLKILSRITEPTSGRAIISGRVGSLLEVGTGFHPELTGRENIFLNGAILGMSRKEIEQRFDEIVAFAEIEKFLDTPVKRYSSGMYVRLAFAVAAHLEPEILLVDEVLAVGDVAFQKKCLGKMSDVAKKGRTVLFVSHNMAAIQGLCERSMLIESGQLSIDGDTSKVISKYLIPGVIKGIEKSPGFYDLSQRINEYYERQLVIRYISLQDSEGNNTNSFIMGKAMKVVVGLKGFSNFRDATIGFIIKDEKDQWLTSITSGMICLGTDSPRGLEEKAILTLPRIPLTPGIFYLDISIHKQGIGRLDFVDRAAKIEIFEGDVYGTGQGVNSYFGLFYLEGYWEIRRE